MTVEQLAARINARVRGDGSHRITGCAGLEDAGPLDISFLANRKYTKRLGDTLAAAVIVSPDVADNSSNTPDSPDTSDTANLRTLLVADDPYFAFRQAMVALHGFREHLPPGISELAVVDPDATIGDGCSIQPLACISGGATIGKNCVIYPHCYVGPGASIGDECVLYPNVTVYDGCHLGNRVVLHAGCVIGQDGFGYATHQGQHHKIPQIGNVVIEDDVEMGAGCAIDRATVGSTRIGKGTKFSDLVAIGHGTSVGEHNLLVAQVGLAGSVKTGNYVAFGGQAGVAGHLEIGDAAQVAAKAGVMNDLPANGQYGGQPAIPLSQAKRGILALARLPELVQEHRALEKRITDLERRIASPPD